MYNTLTINPAYAGSRKMLSAIVLHRSQWLGVDGAPENSSFTIHSPLKIKNLGLGVNIANGRIGAESNSVFDVSVSYSFNLSNSLRLSFGTSIGLNSYSVDNSLLDVFNSNDAIYSTEVDNNLSPKFGAGLLLHSDRFYLGVSSPRLYNKTRLESDYGDLYFLNDATHNYLTSGYILDINQDFKFLPAVLMKYVEGAPIQTDVSFNFSYQNKFLSGLAYRINSGMSALVGYQFYDKWLLGMSYDIPNQKVDFNRGTLEFFLRFEMFKKYGKMVTPRFF
jgi:type IX secretion system PorP/SprF family membrane protein